MASTSRVSLPEEFYDWTSDMLLVQPEPQYLYAQMWLGAMSADLSVPGALGLPGRDVTGVGASYGTPSEKDRLMLSNPMMTSVVSAKVDFNGRPGNTVRINRPLYANTTYTQASRIVTTGQTISTTGIAAQSEQTNLTLFRFAGPYDSTNSRVAPMAIEAFDANMGVHKLAQVVGNSMKRDFHRFIDAVQVTLLDLGTAVYPEGMTAVNDPTTTGSFPFTYEQLSRAEQLADTANLPTFPDGYRAFVGTPVQLKQMKDDPQFARYSHNHPEYNALFPQYVASVGKTHVFKSTTLNITNNSSSVPIHYGHYIAPGVLMAGMGRRPSVRVSTSDNFGETVLPIWLGDLAFGLADSSFCYSVRSSA